MYWPVTPVNLGLAVGFIAVLFLTGCPSVPTTPPSEPQPPPTSLPPPPVVETEIYHTVERGETLYGIATRYGRNFKDVARWNQIPPPYILTPGQRLIVSGPSGEAGEEVSELPATPGIPVEPPSAPEPTPIEIPSSDDEDHHTVQPGETLYGIATRYGHNFRDMAAWNNIEPPYNLRVGQVLIVTPPPGWDPSSKPQSSLQPLTPPPTTLPTEPTSPAAEAQDYHIVQPGDTLFALARHYGFGVADLAAWNSLQPPYNLKVGQQLRVTPPANIPPLPPVPSPSSREGGNANYHFVAAGETLYSISRSYGRSVEELAQWNNLEPPYYLSLGQKLRVTPPSSQPQSKVGGYIRTGSTSVLRPNHHVVKAKETLSSIAKQYGISVRELAEWNGIGSPYTVFPGLTLKLNPH